MSVHVNTTLTNYAQGIAVDESEASLAEWIAPTVSTGIAQGQFIRYDELQDFQTYDTARAVGGKATRIEFKADSPYFNCQPQALEVPIDDAEYEKVGEGNYLPLQQSKVRTLVNNSKVGHNAKVFAAINAGLSPVAGKGVWSNAANDPVLEIDEQIEAIADKTGRMPTRLLLSLSAWKTAKHHAKVLARQPGAGNQGVTFAQFAAMLLNPEIEIRVGVLPANTKKPGAAKNVTSIIGANVYIFHNQSTPDQYDPSFAKTFMTKAGGVDSVWSYREPRAEIFAVDWSEDIQVVSTLLARRLAIS